MGPPRPRPSDSSPIEVDGLTNSTYYTCTVDATNAVGTSAESSASDQFLAAAEPDAPLIAHMLLGNNSVTITVVAPADNGEAISNYEATCTSSDGGDTIVADDPSTTIEVDGLTNGNTYTCAVTATNVMGTSAPTADSASFVAGQVPDAPVVTGVTRGVNVVTVAFTTPWDGSIAIRSYTVTCTSSDGGTTRANQGAASPITVGYLTNGNTYSCTRPRHQLDRQQRRVRPVGLVRRRGHAAPAGRSPARPSAATSVSVAFRSTGDGGDAITAYTVTCVSTNGGTPQHATDVGSPIVVPSLTYLKTYSCTVVATNALGSSAASAASTVFVSATVPSAPSVTGVTRGANSASVTFTTPASNGSAITKYTVDLRVERRWHDPHRRPARSRRSRCRPSPTPTPTPARSPRRTRSVPAAPRPRRRRSSPPPRRAQPTVSSVTRSPGAVSVAFTTPASGGAAITSYKVTCTSSNGGTVRTVTGASSPILVRRSRPPRRTRARSPR